MKDKTHMGNGKNRLNGFERAVGLFFFAHWPRKRHRVLTVNILEAANVHRAIVLKGLPQSFRFANGSCFPLPGLVNQDTCWVSENLILHGLLFVNLSHPWTASTSEWRDTWNYFRWAPAPDKFKSMVSRCMRDFPNTKIKVLSLNKGIFQ